MPLPGNLSFAAPLLLLALLVLPLVWWLLRATPPQPARVPFPAFVILRKLTKSEETPDKTPWWLLLLRLLVAGLLIIGLAGPILNAPQPAPINSGPLLLVVDDSWPAAARWRARSDALVKAVAEARQSGEAAYLLTTSPTRLALPSGSTGDQPAIAPLSPADLAERVNGLKPTALLPDYSTARQRLASLPSGTSFRVRWFTDGVAGDGADEFADALGQLGNLRVFSDARESVPFLRGGTSTNPRALTVERMDAGDVWRGELAALASDGRELTRIAIDMPEGKKSVTAELDLPLAIRNAVAQTRIVNVSSAGAVNLADGRNRQALIGILGTDEARSNALLAGSHYIETALGPYASFIDADLDGLIAAGVSVIFLDDIGRLRDTDIERLTGWIETGGVLIRFAGPSLANTAQDLDPPLLPVKLRGGGRAFGGTLSWEDPQLVASFTPTGPFAGIAPPGDVFVRQQVLANPGPETSAATWASLEDGTPIVTGARLGQGTLALFHTTATPDWSDLPLSQVFIEMLRKLIFLSVSSAVAEEPAEDIRYTPLTVLDGFGAFQSPPPSISGVTLSEAEKGASIATPPGLYGAPEAPFAVNAVSPEEEISPLQLPGRLMEGFTETPPQRLSPFLLILALALYLADALATLRLRGQISGQRIEAKAPASAASLLVPFGLALALSFAAVPTQAWAQDGAAVPPASFAPSSAPTSSRKPLDANIEPLTLAAALKTRLAFVQTGDSSVDRITSAGLASLSRELARRTAIEPASPVGVDPETDDLSVYPVLYWPLVAGAETPSPVALANIENFMRFGGMIIFDTRDDERAIAGIDTPERIALQNILRNIDTPPLSPVPDDHVLTRSFYLIEDLTGRVSVNPVWVEAGAATNDGVTSLIIGGRDWAGAWAADEVGNALLPMAARGPRAREYSYRSGINMVMVALTGNYKSDQVHTPILLERLGR